MLSAVTVLAEVMKLQLPPPANWQDFEDLCLLVWKDIWKDASAQKNGRQGQAQAGVDVFGNVPCFGARQWFGVQCKLIEQHATRLITLDVVKEETRKAEAFVPRLASFTLATTARRDSALQEQVREYSRLRERNKRFGVQLYAWDDISEIIQTRRALFTQLYGNLLAANTPSIIVGPGQISVTLKSRNIPLECAAFFDSPAVQDAIAPLLRNELRNFVVELALNAFEHGGASRCGVALSSTSIEITDNGRPFNALKYGPSAADSGVGLRYVHHLLSEYANAVTADYSRSAGENRVRLLFDRPLATIELDRECVITLKEPTPFARVASVVEYVHIPAGCSAYVFDVPPGAFNPSSLMDFLIDLPAQLAPDVTLTLRFSAVDRLMESLMRHMVSTGSVSPTRFVVE